MKLGWHGQMGGWGSQQSERTGVMSGKEEQGGQAMLVRGVGALVRGRGRGAGVDRGSYGIKMHIC